MNALERIAKNRDFINDHHEKEAFIGSLIRGGMTAAGRASLGGAKRLGKVVKNHPMKSLAATATAAEIGSAGASASTRNSQMKLTSRLPKPPRDVSPF